MRRHTYKAISALVVFGATVLQPWTATSITPPAGAAYGNPSTMTQEATGTASDARDVNVRAQAPDPLPGALSAWLDALAREESGSSSTIKHLDVNGRYSYGCVQFQMGTWLSYGKAFGATEENIYDCGLQKQVAADMITSEYSNWHHWGYTVLHKGIGFPPVL